MSHYGFGGAVKWIDSKGKFAPKATGVPTAEEESSEELLEVVEACQQMKPILLYFWKSKDAFQAGKKPKKDAEVSACEKLQEEVWKQWVITELAKEYVCIRIDKRNADPKVLKNHRAMRAPTIKILDFNLKQIYFSGSPKLKYRSLASVMDKSRKKVESAVQKLADENGTSPLHEKAMARVQVIEQRNIYDKGLSFLAKRAWTKAAEQFTKGTAIEQDSEWKKACETGLKEIDAGKLYVKAERLFQMKRYKECKEILEEIRSDFREATYFATLAGEMYKKVARKVKK
ncbi:MAG: hypothetical protein ACYTFG_08685 [Planctomycetota bacterium]